MLVEVELEHVSLLYLLDQLAHFFLYLLIASLVLLAGTHQFGCQDRLKQQCELVDKGMLVRLLRVVLSHVVVDAFHGHFAGEVPLLAHLHCLEHAVCGELESRHQCQ